MNRLAKFLSIKYLSTVKGNNVNTKKMLYFKRNADSYLLKIYRDLLIIILNTKIQTFL